MRVSHWRRGGTRIGNKGRGISVLTREAVAHRVSGDFRDGRREQVTRRRSLEDQNACRDPSRVQDGA